MLISTFLATLVKFHNHYYAEFEAFLLKTEDKERYRLKKSIILYHSYLSILFFVVTIFVNPFASYWKSVFQIISALGQICTLRSKNYHLIGSFSSISAVASIFCHYFTESEPLTLLGLVLINHHIFFLFPESEIFSKIYLPITFSLIYLMQRQFANNFEIWDEKIEISIKSFNYSWFLILLFHYLGAQNLTTSYRQTLIHNMDIQDTLKNTLGLLEKTNVNLKDALQTRELFIASVSHELRNPLNSITGNIELLRLEAKDEKWQNSLDTCKMNCEVLLGLINNVLDVAKINAEKLELHYQAENFRRVVRKVWLSSEASIKQKKLQGELYIAQDVPKYIEIDSHRITQILLNLIGNAIKFCEKGFVNVDITWHSDHLTDDLKKPSQSLQSKNSPSTGLFSSPSKKEIDIGSYEFENTEKRSVNMQEILGRRLSLKPLRKISSHGVCSIHDQAVREISTAYLDNSPAITKGFIKIQVADSGCGISPETFNKLFDSFAQGDSSITRKFGGAGIGLYITKQIIDKMGGEIYAYSKEGQGSTFVVLIPAKTAKKEDVPLPTSDDNLFETNQSLVEQHPPRALIVDDYSMNQIVLSAYLDKLNVPSDIANNGAEALEKFKSKPAGYYSFITMDLQMPVMDGITASQEIRKYETRKNLYPTPILVITGNCSDNEKMKCLDPDGGVRAWNFYRKPFSLEECKQAVQSILDNKNSRKEKPFL